MANKRKGIKTCPAGQARYAGLRAEYRFAWSSSRSAWDFAGSHATRYTHHEVVALLGAGSSGRTGVSMCLVLPPPPSTL
jgi:hypothetical protein